ncbi:MAG: tRNA (adenosine(37)-N6)-threonylcarbamoyltransferase complex transferase subunit TsaD [Phycisphaerales bacterium]
MTLILGLETSCDETAAAVVQDGRFVLSNVVAAQHKLHERYKGVVPEIASRAHLQNINPVVHEAIAQAGLTLNDIDAIAVGHRPGLIGSLLVGVSAAKTLAWCLSKPLIGVDHVRAHLHAATLVTKTASAPVSPDPGPLAFPALGLVVSGGHSSIYMMQSENDLTLIGSTIDDAVGEAYDKAAVILDVGYPGGPKLDKLAQQGDSSAHDLPRSMLSPDSLDFSFSGLKTAVLYTVRGHPKGRGNAARFERSAADLTDKQKTDIAASFQAAAVDAVILKLQRAVAHMTDNGNAPRSLVIGGGVSANSLLRTRVTELGEKLNLAVRIPAFAYCLDNAAMIAGLAHTRYIQNDFDNLDLPALASGSL